MKLSDTSPKASKVYYERLAEMTPSQRLRIGFALYEASQRLQWSMARRKYPEASETELAFHIAVARYGPELAHAAYRKA